MLGKWVKDARAKWGRSQEALANEIEVTKGNVWAWEHDKHSPNVGQVIDISLATGFPVPSDVQVKIAAALEISSGNAAEGIRVPMLANEASMGIGTDSSLDGDVMTGQITLTTKFVTDQVRPTRTDSLRFIHAYGDSMAPTMNSGDVLLVDTGVKEVKIDGIYVLRAHERLFVKRVRQRMDGKFEISSDNPTHKTVDVLNGDHEVAVIGRVVWAWNGHGM